MIRYTGITNGKPTYGFSRSRISNPSRIPLYPHPFVERLIGMIRREYLDCVFFCNAQDLERKLGTFLRYYNHTRAHQSLDGNAPADVSVTSLGDFSSSPVSMIRNSPHTGLWIQWARPVRDPGTRIKRTWSGHKPCSAGRLQIQDAQRWQGKTKRMRFILCG